MSWRDLLNYFDGMTPRPERTAEVVRRYFGSGHQETGCLPYSIDAMWAGLPKEEQLRRIRIRQSVVDLCESIQKQRRIA